MFPHTFIEVHENPLELSKKSKNCIWKETGLSKDQILLVQTIPDQIFGTKWSNLVKVDRKKSLVSVFASFSTAIRKVIEERLGTRPCAHPNMQNSA